MKIDVLHEVIEADVLCVGGGIAGLMAAIRASECGAKVVLLDKENTLFSGAGGAGNDHFLCYIPEVHGPDIDPFLEEFQISFLGKLWPRSYARHWLSNTFDIVKLWDSWGIPMKHNGEYEFAGHAFPGRPLPRLHYYGKDQKKVLTKQAVRRGVKIINRVVAFDLVRDGRVIGAIGASTREDKVVGVASKSVILGTGHLNRLYPSPTPAWMANVDMPFNLTGDGRAMAYRAGAELFNMEIPKYWAGLKYFVRSGKGSWMGVYRDPSGKPVGPFVTQPNKLTGDATADIAPTIFRDYANSARGPVYMDCRGQTQEEYEYMLTWLYHEGGACTLKHMEEEGIDLRNNPVEFMTYAMFPVGGVRYNEKGETSVGGLFASGMETFTDISGSAVSGYFAGENAAAYAKQTSPPSTHRVEAELMEKRALIEEIRGRETGPDWKEANIALQQIMYDYAGAVRSQTMLEAGLTYLRRLREKARTTMSARNPHELWRCLEVLNLLDLGELVFVTALERKETRGQHIRSDYPITNPLLDSLLMVKKDGNGVALEWRRAEH